MPKYLAQARYSPAGLKGLMKEGGTKRREAVENAMKSVGGRVDAFYFAFGETDVFSIVDIPDQVSAVAISGVINASGASTVRLTPLITVEEVDKAVKKAAQYRAPGQ